MRQTGETTPAVLGTALAGVGAMDRLKRILPVLWIAGCSHPGGPGDNTGSGNHEDASTQTTDGNPSNQGDANTSPGDASTVFAANDRCSDAIAIDMNNSHTALAVNPTNSHADLAAPCGTAGVPDVFFSFTLTRRQLIYADTFGSSASTALYFASSCNVALTSATTAGDAVCSAGACGTSQSQVVALLDPGTYYLLLATQGTATIHFQHAEVGSGNVAQLPQGTTTQTGTTSGVGTLYACDAGGPENTYWWSTCPADQGGAFTASTCNGSSITTDFDTMLSLQMPGSDAVLCDDDSCSFQSTIGTTVPAGAGLHAISVDGFSSSKLGSYSLAVTRP